MNPMSVTQALVAVGLSAVIIFLTRAFPFILFSKREPPTVLRFIEKYIPPMIMGVLVVYSLKDVKFTAVPYGVPHIISIAVTAVLHLWKKNSMVSIFGGTILFMILSRVM